MKLIKIRREIDKLDVRLVDILAKRMSYVSEVAEYKRKNNVKRLQKDRENEIYDNLAKKAAELDLNAGLLKDLFKRIIKESHRIEKEIMKV